jgi:hypothetical protein
VIGHDAGGEDPTLIALMEKRLSEYQAQPGQVSNWEEVKARLLAPRR